MKIPYSDECFKILWLQHVLEFLYYSDFKSIRAKYGHKIFGPELYTETFEFIDYYKSYNEFWEYWSVVDPICEEEGKVYYGDAHQSEHCPSCNLALMMKKANLPL